MNYLSITCITSTFVFLFLIIKYDATFLAWNKQLLDKQFGLVHVGDFGLSYKKNGRKPALIIDFGGVHLRTSSSPATSNNKESNLVMKYTSKFYQQVPKPAISYMLNKSTQLLMRTVLSDAVLYINNLTIEKDGLLSHKCCVYTDFKLLKTTDSAVYSIGPINFYDNVNDKPSVDL